MMNAETDSTVWLNGVLLPEREALVPAMDQGWLTGCGVFETLGVWNGRPFALTRHLARLEQSAGRLKIPVPDADRLRAALVAVTAENRLENARVRITLTAGAADRGVLPQVLVSACAVTPPADEIALVTVPWRRNEYGALSGIKTTAYAENPAALDWARLRGGGEALFWNTGGDLCECAMSNLFLVRRGQVITPSLGSGCLPGVTRALTLDLCLTAGIPYVERAVAPIELADAEEIFITSSIRGVQPVCAVDSRAVLSPGPVAGLLRRELWRLRETADDP